MAFTAFATGSFAGGVTGGRNLRAPIIWYDDDCADIASPKARDPNLTWDGVNETFFRPLGRMTHPGRLVRGAGTLFGGDPVGPASNVNRLDEVPNSSWFTNRIGLFPFSPQDAARGPGDGTGPSRDAPWTVIRAKSDGVTPGFTVRDSRGVVYFVKFDAPGLPNAASAAGVISGRILYAAGYNVPDDGIVTIRREDLMLGDGVQFTSPDGKRRPMTPEYLDAILRGVETTPEGEWRAIVSRRLSGSPIGPFDYMGRRSDDPNDRVNHEDRRELRGLRVFAAWIEHVDTKQQNTLDMFESEDGRHFVRHYLIDFASTLGTGATSATPRPGWEFTVDLSPIIGRLGALGLHQDAWRRIERPAGLPEIGYFESRLFDPEEFKPLEPNAAFANLTDRDGYWAAKIITAFTDEHLRAIAAAGRYRDPAATAYIARTLAERRDKIGRLWLDRIPPLDFFSLRGRQVEWRDLGEERGLYPGTTPHYRARTAVVGADGEAGAWTSWIELAGPSCDLPATTGSDGQGGIDPVTTDSAAGAVKETPLRALECQVNRGKGWSRTVRVFIDLSRRQVVGLER